MKSRQIIPQEIGGLNTDDKSNILEGVCFQWKVGLTYIKRNKLAPSKDEK